MESPKFTFIDSSPTVKMIQRWITDVQEGQRKEEARLEALRQEVLKEPLPELTGLQWAQRVADAMKAWMAVPVAETFDPEHPVSRALDVALIQARAAGWNITTEHSGKELPVSPSGMVEIDFTLTKPTDPETPT